MSKQNKRPRKHLQLPQKQSYKQSQDKPKLSLIPKEALWVTGEAFNYGIKKHGKHRFKESDITITELLDAAIRHIYQFIDGENYDKDSKLHHLGSAMSNLCMAIWIYFNKLELDDRFIKRKKKC